jgi:serine/threonine protein kinase
MEGMSACRVDHPNAVAIWDAGLTEQGVLFLVMELLTGRTVREELIQKRTMSALRCLEISRIVCDVLQAAHQVDVVHRDIKPDNIFLHMPKDSAEVVKVLDFGIAKLLNHVGINDGTMGPMAGTPEYVAPERFLSLPYDGRSDIYGLGCMMYELIAGRVPFMANKEMPWLVAAQHLEQQPVSLGEVAIGVPPSVVELIHSALAKNPEERPSASTFLHSIDNVIAQLSQESLSVGAMKNQSEVDT